MEKQQHILVVDDEEPVRNTLEQILKAEGFKVSTAKDGEEGLETLSLLESMGDLPDLVISDYRMAEITGIDYLTQVKEKYPEIIRVLLTAYSDEELAIQAIKTGVNDYIRKVGDSQDSLGDAVTPIIRGWLKKEKRPKIELRPKSVNAETVDFSKYTDVPCFIGDHAIKAKGYSNGIVPIKDFATGEILAYMPNLTDDDIKEGLEWLHEKAKAWNKLHILEKCERISQGVRNLKDEKYSQYFRRLIPRTGGFSLKRSVLPDIKDIINFGQNSVHYLKHIFGNENVEKNKLKPISVTGKEGLATLITESMVETTAYGIISALRASALFHKYDSNNPITAMVMAHALRRAGVPINTFYFDTGDRPYVGKELIIDNVTRTEFMGLPIKLFNMYYEGSLKRISADTPSAKIEILKRQLAMPHNVDYYTAHLGHVYVHNDVDLERVIPEITHSIISHYRSCKRALNVVFHPDIADEATKLLTMAFSELKVDYAKNPEADIVIVNDKYWDWSVGKSLHLLKKGNYGDLIFGENNKFEPKLIKIENDALNSEDFSKYASRETMFAYANLYKGDEKFAEKLGHMIAKEQYDDERLILTSGTFTKDPQIYDFIRNSYFAYDNNFNLATTKGLGGTGIDNKYRFVMHQGIALEKKLFRCDS